MISRHCPTCRCGDAGRLVINVDAPFFPLVAAVDRLVYARWIERRTSSRRANAETRRRPEAE